MKNPFIYSVLVLTWLLLCTSCKDDIPTNPDNTIDTTDVDSTSVDSTRPKIYFFTPEKGTPLRKIRIYGKNFLKDYEGLQLNGVWCWDFNRQTINDTDMIDILIPEKASTGSFVVLSGGMKDTSEKIFTVIPKEEVFIDNVIEGIYSICPGATFKLTGQNLTCIDNLWIVWMGRQHLTAKVLSITDTEILIEAPQQLDNYYIQFNYLDKKHGLYDNGPYESLPNGKRYTIGNKEFLSVMDKQNNDINFAYLGDTIRIKVNNIGQEPEVKFNGQNSKVLEHYQNGYHWTVDRNKIPNWHYTDENGYIECIVPSNAKLPITVRGSCGEVQVNNFELLPDRIFPAAFKDVTVNIENLEYNYNSSNGSGITSFNKDFPPLSVVNYYDSISKTVTCNYFNFSETYTKDEKTRISYSFSLTNPSNAVIRSYYYKFERSNYGPSTLDSTLLRVANLSKIMDDPFGLKKTVFQAVGSNINLTEFYQKIQNSSTQYNWFIESKGLILPQPVTAKITITINYK